MTPRCAAAAVVSAVCGAPTTDERIHAPVLHDASQIDYCRYGGRASLPPITSISIMKGSTSVSSAGECCVGGLVVRVLN